MTRLARRRAGDLARWTTTLTASYLLVTAALTAIAGQSIPGRLWLVATHVALAIALLSFSAAPSSATIRLVRDWHPLFLFPFLFKEVESLSAAFGDWRLTSTIPVLEATLFGGQPSQYLSQRLASVPLSEFLHFCYLAYLVVIPAVAGFWYFSNRRRAFHELLLALSVVMLGSYLFFILFPVDSPYYLSAPLAPPLSDHFFFKLVHQISARGGARGGAFPSAHVSGALVVLLVAWRHQPRLAGLLVPIVAGVVMATVYGRFHYALDTIAGLLLGTIVVFACRHVVNSQAVKPPVIPEPSMTQTG